MKPLLLAAIQSQLVPAVTTTLLEPPAALKIRAVLVMKPLLLAAIQSQLVPAVTTTLLEPPAALKLALVESSKKVQPTPVWTTVNVWPAMVIVPLTSLLLVLAAMV